jgi:hypothetical protein
MGNFLMGFRTIAEGPLDTKFLKKYLKKASQIILGFTA